MRKRIPIERKGDIGGPTTDVLQGGTAAPPQEGSKSKPGSARWQAGGEVMMIGGWCGSKSGAGVGVGDEGL